MNIDPIAAESFELTIKLGNSEMQTPFDIAEQLRAVANDLDDLGEHAGRTIRDINGARVGSWMLQKATREQKLEELAQFLESRAGAQVDGHSFHDGIGCKGHGEAFLAKAELLLELIEDDYGYADR